MIYGKCHLSDHKIFIMYSQGKQEHLVWMHVLLMPLMLLKDARYAFLHF